MESLSAWRCLRALVAAAENGGNNKNDAQTRQVRAAAIFAAELGKQRVRR